jgi:hypothetical protein
MEARRVRRAIAALLLIVGAMGLSAQAKANSKTIGVRVFGVVPAVLNLDLSFASNSETQLVGHTDAMLSDASGNGAGSFAFALREGVSIELGYATLFSNLLGSFSILVWSANDGLLKDPSGGENEGVPYSLSIGDKTAEARGGVFRFEASGKTARFGDLQRVSIALGEIPAGASVARFTDNLVFSLASN